jgi:hypothetical protein
MIAFLGGGLFSGIWRGVREESGRDMSWFRDFWRNLVEHRAPLVTLEPHGAPEPEREEQAFSLQPFLDLKVESFPSFLLMNEMLANECIHLIHLCPRARIDSKRNRHATSA